MSSEDSEPHGVDAALRGEQILPPMPSLESLAPRYIEEQHGTYLRHLEAQVANPKNLNIALTGRYGTGKSSVLDEFEARHTTETIRLGISTLDPAAPGAELTNRLQKELVKQLMYQASPESRCRRTADQSLRLQSHDRMPVDQNQTRDRPHSEAYRGHATPLVRSRHHSHRVVAWP